MDSITQAYYRENENIIKQSLTLLFPETCTENWLHQITGRNELTWDTQTLDTFFLQPINAHLKNKSIYPYAAGCLLLLQNSNLSIEKHLPAIAISEGFECCFQLFKSVGTTQTGQSINTGLEIDAAVNANVAVALIALPLYPVLLNIIPLEINAKLWILKNTTQSISRVFYANGLRQYNKQSKTYFKNEQAYEQYAYYLNSPKLKFNLDYWIALNEYTQNKSIINSCENIIKLFSITNQLISDYQSYTIWSNSVSNYYSISFEPNNFIHTLLAATVNKYDVESMPKAFIDLFDKKNTATTIRNKINKSKVELNLLIDELPLSQDYNQLFKSYIQDLLLTA